jgi:hypothetical protein
MLSHLCNKWFGSVLHFTMNEYNRHDHTLSSSTSLYMTEGKLRIWNRILPHFKLKLYICEWIKLILLLENTPYCVDLSKQKLNRTGKAIRSRDMSYNELACMDVIWYQIQSLCLKTLTSFLYFRTKDFTIFWNRKNKVFENALPYHNKWISLQCCISQCVITFEPLGWN